MSKQPVVKSKHVRLLESLVKGNNYSVAQIKSQFKAKNPYDVILKLRQKGVCIDTYQKNGKTFYKLASE